MVRVEFLIACNGFRVRVCYDVVGRLAYYIITLDTPTTTGNVLYSFLVKGIFEIKIAFI